MLREKLRTASIAAINLFKTTSPAAVMPLLLKARPQQREPPAQIKIYYLAPCMKVLTVVAAYAHWCEAGLSKNAAMTRCEASGGTQNPTQCCLNATRQVPSTNKPLYEAHRQQNTANHPPSGGQPNVAAAALHVRWRGAHHIHDARFEHGDGSWKGSRSSCC